MNTLFPIDEGDLDALHARLALAAEQEGMLDIAYRTLDTPIGALLLAATVRGLARIAFEREGFDAVLDALAVKISPRILEAPDRLSGAARQLDEYFAGERHTFDLPLDYRLSSDSGRSYSSTCRRSATATPPHTRRWPRRSANPAPSGRSDRRARRTRCR